MKKALVAYFSATGVTRGFAEQLSKIIGADMFEIRAAETYTKEDLDWTKSDSRTSIEKLDPTCRPEMVETVENFADYDTLFLGFPVWWDRQPAIVDTFLDSLDLAGKTVALFCTSGGGGAGETTEKVRAVTGENVKVVDVVELTWGISQEDFDAWMAECL